MIHTGEKYVVLEEAVEVEEESNSNLPHVFLECGSVYILMVSILRVERHN